MDKYEQEQAKKSAINLANMTYTLYTELYKKTNHDRALTLNLMTCLFKGMFQQEQQPSLNILWERGEEKGE